MIREKRESLEEFIREQIVGPGVNGYKIVDISNNDILGNDLSTYQPLRYENELLNIVPAGVYSSGVLFPVDKSKDDGLKNMHWKEGLSEDEDNSGRESDEDSVEEQDSIQIDQMYPNSVGMTCCFDKEILSEEGPIINVAARYYSKLDIQHGLDSSQIGVLCEVDKTKLDKVLSSIKLTDRIAFFERGVNLVMLLKPLKQSEISDSKALLRSIDGLRLNELKKELYMFKFAAGAKNLSALKQGCYYELKKACVDESLRSRIYDVSQTIEEHENVVSHIKDLIDLQDTRSYGIWKSNPISIDIPFPDKLPRILSGKMIYTYRSHPSLHQVFKHELSKDVCASLSLNLQLSSDSRKIDDKVFLKVQLINTSTPFRLREGDSRYFSAFNAEVNKRCFFGVRISVTHRHLRPYNLISSTVKEFDADQITRFLYRQFEDYGIGHGTSVTWSKVGGVQRVSTEYLPHCDTPEVDFIPKNKTDIVKGHSNFEPSPFLVSTKALEFKWLSTLSDATSIEVVTALKEFVESYRKWIDLKREKYLNESTDLQRIVHNEMDKCLLDQERMRRNIDVFLDGPTNSNNLEAFRIMNAVMFIQLWHSIKTKSNEIQTFMDGQFVGFNFNFYKELDDRLFGTESVSWRPFQLAFILLNLDGIFNPKGSDWKERNELVDLVWFPTGGGKTEAYLGLIALTIINRRRIWGSKGGGTAAIMRYTLRLLTLQQFQRATLMIMALELVRRWQLYDLGDQEPIYIGLWVGDDSLPNRMMPINDSDKNNLLTEFGKLSQSLRSKVPFEKCPWCSSKLAPSLQQEISKGFFHNRLHLKCSNAKCSFSLIRPSSARLDQGPIPVSLCDEEIYEHPPALLFGTVDKFAQLAHKVSDNEKDRNKDSRRIFGKGNWEAYKPKDGYIPPDLIIQDELHLLLGPLGSSVALFECAIDQLSTRADGTRPKIISSTATTRNTDLQIMALFDRRVNLFPKPGVECDDSFFAFYKRSYSDQKGAGQKYFSKRRYIGILPTGKTQIWMQMRLAAILATHRAIFELKGLGKSSPLDFGSYNAEFGKAMDYYHTIISYFNSIKEVGKTESQINSYLVKEVRLVYNRVIRRKKLCHAIYTYSLRKAELTGRLSGEEVANELEKVQQKWTPSARFARLDNGLVIAGEVPPDFVVATNMISVGIDVSRFNLIIVNSMPRNIAEYIQASSRVARDSYGLVLTVHHPFRARDLSHYEKFVEFHEKMYSYVEPISITPFTQKAVERYLGLYLATMIRHSTEFHDRLSAGNISNLNDGALNSFIESFYPYFEKRFARLSSSALDSNTKDLLREENVLTIKEWISAAVQEWVRKSREVSLDNAVLVFNNKGKTKTGRPQEQLYVDIDEYDENVHIVKWQIPMSLRVIEPEAAIKIKLK